MTTSALLDDLAGKVSLMPADRQGALVSELEKGAMAEEQQPVRDVPGQLDLFGFKHLVEVDDQLKLVSLPQITEVYGISNRTLHRHIAGGKLHAVRFGRGYMVQIAELKRFFTEESRHGRSKGRKRQGTKPAAKAHRGHRKR